MSLTILLMLFQKLKLFSEMWFLDHLRSNNTFVKSLRHFSHSTSNRPCVLNYFKDLSIDSPFDWAKYVQHLANVADVGSLQIPNSLIEVGQHLRKFGLLEVISTKEVVFPRSRLIDHWKRSLQLQWEIMDLVYFTNKSLYEWLIEDDVSKVLVIRFLYDLWLQE